MVRMHYKIRSCDCMCGIRAVVAAGPRPQSVRNNRSSYSGVMTLEMSKVQVTLLLALGAPGIVCPRCIEHANIDV